MLAFLALLALTQDPVFPALPAGAEVGTGVTQPCTAAGLLGTARCGAFRVYEDRDAMRGRTIDLHFVVLEATGDSTVDDAVILLPGGPGQAFTPGMVPLSRGMPAIRAHRDIVLVDVRGVGRSARLDCGIPFPGGVRSRFGTMFPLDHAAACRDTLSRRARLDRYTTASSVDDLEDLRRWLGYGRWNLSGGSYGTRVAQVYMRRHPASVRTAVLNGVAPISRPVYVTHALLLQRALDRLVEECRGDSACGAAYPSLAADVARLLERFADAPVPVELDGTTVEFTRGDVAYALRGLLYGRGHEIPNLVTQAAAGDVTPLAEYYLERVAWVGDPEDQAGYHFTVLCAEDIAPLTDADVAAATRNTFMGSHLINGYRSVCRQWPYARLPRSHWEPVVSDTPTLLLSGARDPVTPPEGAEVVMATLSRALHVVVPNGGHGVGGPCVLGMITRLIDTGSLDGIGTSCIQRAPPTRFRLP